MTSSSAYDIQGGTVGVALAGLVAARVLPGVKEYQRRAQAFQDALARVNLKAKKASKS